MRGAAQPTISDRLDSWKEIASYLRRDIRTVQRWEKTEALPVHRHPHEKLGSVYAFKPELDAWWRDGHERLEPQQAESVTPQPIALPHPLQPTVTAPTHGTRMALVTRRWLVALALVLSGVLAVGLATWLATPPPLPRVARYVQITHDGRKKGAPLLTNGSHVFFTEATPSGPTLASVPVEGGETILTPIPLRDVLLCDISLRRSEILVLANAPDDKNRELWTVSYVGGSPRRVGELAVSSAAWSPDGKLIAFTKQHDSTLYLANADGSGSRKLLTLSGFPSHVQWTNDGQRLRYAASEFPSANPSNWEVAADGSGLHRFPANPPAWPRDRWGSCSSGGRYLFCEYHANGESQIWVSPERADLTLRQPLEPARLTYVSAVYISPLASPDGKKVFAVGIEKHGELVRFDTRLGEFVPYLGGISVTSVDFSKDGQWVAFITYPESILGRSRLDGSERIQLSFPPLEADGLAWSPDGSKIAVRARMPGKPWKIYLVPARGGELQRLTASDLEEGIPSWSPDGRKIAFGEVPAEFGLNTAEMAIHVFDLTTHDLSTLPGSKGLWTARWSPDGRTIAALTAKWPDVPSAQRLMLFDIASEKWRERGVGNVESPVWSRDARWLYFNYEGQDLGIFRTLISNGKTEPVVDLKGFLRNEKGPGWAGLAPDGSPLISRNIGANEIYALELEFP